MPSDFLVTLRICYHNAIKTGRLVAISAVTPQLKTTGGVLGEVLLRELTFNLCGRGLESRPGSFMLEGW